jgi:hypothetical protein
MSLASSDSLFKNATISLRNGWLTLSVAGQGTQAFQLANVSIEQASNEVDRFAEILKGLLRGEKPAEWAGNTKTDA